MTYRRQTESHYRRSPPTFRAMFRTTRSLWKPCDDLLPFPSKFHLSVMAQTAIGYKELTNFRTTENYLKNAEMQMEDDLGMIDGIINNGPKEEPKPVKQAEETKTKKPSVLAKLRQYQKEDREKTTQHRSAERDLI